MDIMKGFCYLLVFVVLSVAAVEVAAFLYPYPIHASCQVTWKFQSKCADVNKRIVSRMNTWKTDENCKNGGEKCLYKVVSQSDEKITGTHETPKAHYVDDLTFAFKQPRNTTCVVDGKSTSQLWYAVLDYGTNYCNLHNIITGEGLDKLPGYSEATADKQCTQYSKADCEKY